MRQRDLAVGARVRSKRVGAHPEFIGTIEDVISTSACHVRSDDDGQIWHRSPSELSLIDTAAEPVSP